MMRDPRYVIAVPDLKASERFYRDVLGFEVHEIGDPGWRFFVRDRVFIMAGECPDALPPRELGDHSWFAWIEVDDIDAFHDAVRAKGAEVISPPANEPWGMREFGIRTADGHRIRFGCRIREGGSGASRNADR
jgi:catechol 2,3-dioxygenase-like lactoylglutathione lyase family enzyme